MDDIYRLSIIIEELDTAKIRWCVDHGTLLGLVREQRLIPWDCDIDLSINLEDLEKCFWALHRIKSNLNAHLVRTSRNIKIFPFRESGREIDIGTYSLTQDGSFEKHLVMYPRSKDIDWKRSRQFLWWQLRRMEWLLRGAGLLLQNMENRFPALAKMYLQTFCTVVHIRESFGVSFISKIPQNYFFCLKRLTWRGLHISVPSSPERYLSYRYGDDWYIPQKEWVWWRNDKSMKLKNTRV